MDEGEIDRQLRKLVEQLKHENERLRAAFNSRNGQIESQTKSNPILYGHQKIFAALFRSFAGCPDSSLIGHFTVIRLFVIYNLVDGLRDRNLDVLEEHIKRVTPPKDNSFIPKS